MATITRFEDLKIWKDAIRIGVEIYRMSMDGKLAKDWGVRDQVRRSAVSISNNIAEGFEHNNNKVFMKYLKYSKASAGELRSNLYLLREASIIDETAFEKMNDELIELSRQLEGFIQYLKSHTKKRP